MSSLGFGGTAGVSSSLRFMELNTLIATKIANATIRKSTMVWMNAP